MSPEEFMKELGKNFNLEYHKKCLLEMIKNHNDPFTYVEYKSERMNGYEIDAMKHFLDSCGIDFEFKKNGYMQDEAFLILMS